MILSDMGQARVRGYLYVLERSLQASLLPAIAADAVREVESHIRDRVAETEPLPDERAALERILAALGTPTRVARAYSLELSVEEALVTGRFVATLRVIWLLASTTIGGFVAALLLITGYTSGFGLLVVGVLTAVLPAHFGLEIGDGSFSFGPFSGVAGRELHSGSGVVVLCVVLGLGLLVLTHKGARAWMRWMRTRISRTHTNEALERVRATAGMLTDAARARSLERSIDEAVVTTRLVATLRVVWLFAAMTVGGFFGAIVIFVGYISGAAFLGIAVAHLVGGGGVVMMFGEPQRGWWVPPFCFVVGFSLIVGTHRGARAWIRWIGGRIKSLEPSSVAVNLRKV